MNSHSLISGHECIVDLIYDPWDGYCFDCCIEHLFLNFDINNLQIHIYEVGSVLLNSINDLYDRYDLEKVYERILIYMYKFIVYNCNNISKFKENIIVMESFLIECLQIHNKITLNCLIVLNNQFDETLSSKNHVLAKDSFIENIWQLRFTIKILSNYYRYSAINNQKDDTLVISTIVQLIKVSEYIYDTKITSLAIKDESSTLILKLELFSFLSTIFKLVEKDKLRNYVDSNKIYSLIICIMHELLENEEDVKQSQMNYLINLLNNNRFSYLSQTEEIKDNILVNTHVNSNNNNSNNDQLTIHLFSVLYFLLSLNRQQIENNVSSSICDILDYMFNHMPFLVQTVIQLAKQGLLELEKCNTQSEACIIASSSNNTNKNTNILYYNGVAVIVELLELGIKKDMLQKDFNHFSVAVKIIERIVKDDCNYISKLFALYEKSLLLNNTAFESIIQLQLYILQTFSNLSDINPRLFYHFTNYTQHIFHTEYHHYISMISTLNQNIHSQHSKASNIHNKRKFNVISEYDKIHVQNQKLLDYLLTILVNGINFNPKCLVASSLTTDIIKECSHLLCSTESIFIVSYIVPFYIPIILSASTYKGSNKSYQIGDEHAVFHTILHTLETCAKQITTEEASIVNKKDSTANDRLFSTFTALMEFLVGQMQYDFLEFLLNHKESLQRFQHIGKALLSNATTVIKVYLDTSLVQNKHDNFNDMNNCNATHTYVFEVIQLLLINKEDITLMPFMNIFENVHQNRRFHNLLCQYVLNYISTYMNTDRFEKYFQLYAKYIFILFNVYSIKSNHKMCNLISDIEVCLKTLSQTIFLSDLNLLSNLSQQNLSIISCKLVDYIAQLHNNSKNNIKTMEDAVNNTIASSYMVQKCVALYLACCLDCSTSLDCIKVLLTYREDLYDSILPHPKHPYEILETLALEISLSFVECPVKVCYENTMSLKYLFSIFSSFHVENEYFVIQTFHLILEGISDFNLLTLNKSIHTSCQLMISSNAVDYWKSCVSDTYCIPEYIIYELSWDSTSFNPNPLAHIHQSNIVSSCNTSGKFLYTMIFRVLHHYTRNYGNNRSTAKDVMCSIFELIPLIKIEELIGRSDHHSSFIVYLQAVSTMMKLLNDSLNNIKVIISVDDKITLGYELLICLTMLDRLLKYKILANDEIVLSPTELENIICSNIFEPCQQLLGLQSSCTIVSDLKSTIDYLSLSPFQNIKDVSTSIINNLSVISLKKKTLLLQSFFTGYWSLKLNKDSFDSLLHYFLLIYFIITNNEKLQLNKSRFNSTLYLLYNSDNNKDNNSSKSLDVTDAMQFIEATMKHYLIQQPSSLYVSILNLNIGSYSEQESNLSISQLQQEMLQYSLLCLSVILFMTIKQQTSNANDADMMFPFMLLTQCQEILAAIDVCLLKFIDNSVSFVLGQNNYNTTQVTKFIMLELQSSILQFSNAYCYFNVHNITNQQPWYRYLSNSIATMKDNPFNESENVKAMQNISQDQPHWNQNITYALIATLEKIYLLFITQLTI